MSSSIETRYGTVVYTDTGEGPAVVLLHANLHDHRDYDPIAVALARHYRVIALDWPGHGQSPTSPVPLSATGLADTLAEVVTALDLDSVALMGNSVGGYAAARLAIERPDLVAALVLINTGGFGGNAMSRALCRSLGNPRVLKWVLPGLIRAYMQARNSHDRAIRERALGRARTRAGIADAAALWRSFAEPAFDLRSRADEIIAPTLIVWGARDPVNPLPFGKATYNAIPSARFAQLPTGHLPFASQPQRFLALVEPFLAEAFPAPPADK